MAYELVSYAPELEAQIAALQTHLWSGDAARNAVYLRWKYLENPYLDEVLIQLLRCDGEIVAMRGMFGTLWEADGGATRHVLPYADDFVVAPAHRNRGPANQVMKASLRLAEDRGFPFALNLSAAPVTFVSSLAAGWRSAGSYRNAWRNAGGVSHLQRLRTLLPAPNLYRRLNALLLTLRPHGAFAGLDRSAAQLRGRLSLARAARPQEMAELVAKVPWDGRIRHVRDASYFAWRFRNPLHEYRFLFVDDGDLRGYLVLQRYVSDRLDQLTVNIVDWEATDDGVRRELLDAALRLGRFGRMQSWTVSLDAAAQALLRDHGFAVVVPDAKARHSGLLLRRLGDARRGEPWTLGGRDLLDIGAWDLRMLYSMAG